MSTHTTAISGRVTPGGEERPTNSRGYTATIAVLPGDGVGPEVITAAVAILERVAGDAKISLNLVERPVGGAAIDAEGTPLPPSSRELCGGADAILFGAAGGPRWDHLRGDARPGAATLRLRRDLGLSINLRPVRAFPPLLSRSPLRAEVIREADFVIVRELTGGAYFGDHGRTGEGLDETAHDVASYSRREVRRAATFAFALAARRRGRLTSVDKANVLWSGRLWRDVVAEMATEHPEIAVEHALVDSFALRMLQHPDRLDVVLTENLLGDILSDEAAAISGSLGLMASASLNPAGGPGLYEPIHGSAPDIAGRGIANPIGAILSAALLLEHALSAPREAARIRAGVDAALAAGAVTPDLGGAASTAEVTAAVLGALSPHDGEGMGR
jgi:3-isopropylmalate dehydrogenase